MCMYIFTSNEFVIYTYLSQICEGQIKKKKKTQLNFELKTIDRNNL